MVVEQIFFRFPGIPGVNCLFQGRCKPGENWGSICPASDPAALLAREQLALTLGRRGASMMAECKQVHGVNLLVNPGAEAAAAEADGMMTDRPGLALLIRTADCQPLFISDSAGRHVLALHVGWRGNRADFPAIGVEAFCRQYDLQPEELVAVRGPSLGKAEFVNFASEWGKDFAPWYREATREMDLWALTRQQLIRAGMQDGRIFGIDICTSANAHAFFSYRHGDRIARQASAIWIACATRERLS